MRLALALALLLAGTPQHRRFRQPNLPGETVAGPVAEPCPRTNFTPFSEQFQSVAWLLDNGGGAAAPITTADQAANPLNGAMNADRVQYSATNGGGSSIHFQKACPNGAVSSASLYVKGVSGSGTMDLCILASLASPQCASCSFTSTGWTRCTKLNVTTTTNEQFVYIGNASAYNGGTARAASDVYVWGAQCEDAATVSGYIGPTLEVPVTRECS